DMLVYALIAFVIMNLLSMITPRTLESFRMRVLSHGTTCLKAFIPVTVMSAVYHIGFLVFTVVNSLEWDMLLFSALMCTCVLAVLFWNGIICVYCTSVQLGIKHRVIGIVLGPFFPFNLIMLYKIIKVTSVEFVFEKEKFIINKERADKQICKTTYPLLLVHGMFFRDSKYLNYWGRIPGELEKNGAVIYYGEHQSASSVRECALELAERIKKIVSDTGCEKLNIIAHSKGGLDCRELLAVTDAAKYVASLTTVNSPHRGCKFADCLLDTFSESMQTKVANTYNAALSRLGDTNPDFMKAVRDLSSSVCTERDAATPLPDGVFTQSIGSKLERAMGGKFPLNYSYHLVKHFDGANDGLVGEESFKWGDNYIFVKPSEKRGISHADMIDLNRENISGFDVREFYVKLVSELKERGL
ncbi:MAG: triacylglycerol lipase, partial [Clostridia bacterium]|nr:triacylglycerol lipase [Clostridia bacterium]